MRNKARETLASLKQKLKARPNKRLCDEWLGKQGIKNFEKFFNSKLKEYYSQHTGPYNKSNSPTLHVNYNDSDIIGPNSCEIIPRSEVSKLRAYCRTIIAFGETHDLVTWGKLLNIPHNRIRARLNNGWDPYDALTIPSSYTLISLGLISSLTESIDVKNYSGPRYNKEFKLVDSDGNEIKEKRMNKKFKKKDRKLGTLNSEFNKISQDPKLLQIGYNAKTGRFADDSEITEKQHKMHTIISEKD